MKYKLSVLMLMLMISCTLYANDSDCPTNVSGINNGEWCDAYSVEQHQKMVDKQLNTVYKSFIKSLSNDDKKRWVIAQRAWISYRDANCSAEVGYRPSSPSTAQYVYQSCLSEETEKRVQIFKNYCEERGC